MLPSATKIRREIQQQVNDVAWAREVQTAYQALKRNQRRVIRSKLLAGSALGLEITERCAKCTLPLGTCEHYKVYSQPLRAHIHIHSHTTSHSHFQPSHRLHRPAHATLSPTFKHPPASTHQQYTGKIARGPTNSAQTLFGGVHDRATTFADDFLDDLGVPDQARGLGPGSRVDGILAPSVASSQVRLPPAYHNT